MNFDERLIKFKEKNNEILKVFFTDKIRTEDITELLHTTEKVEIVLTKVLSQKYYLRMDPNALSFKIFQRSVEKLEGILEEFYITLTNLVKTKQLERTLNNSNLRRKIEQLGSSLAIEISNLEDKHNYLSKEIQSQTNQPNSPNLPLKDDSKEKITIEDAEGQAMWEKEFGPNTFMAEWDRLTDSISREVGSKIQDDIKRALKHVLDNSNTGYVSSWKFSEFLKGFGPLTKCLVNLSNILNEKWFHGFLNKEETRKLLEFQPVGTFLVRFSSSKPGSFALAYTSSPRVVNHVIIKTLNKAFSIQEQTGEKHFENVGQIVKHYGSVLNKPFDSTLPEEPWFHGDIEGSEAEELLRNKKVGTFLIRFSSQPGFFAGSYVDASNNVAKCLIASSPSFYLADKDGVQYGQFPTMSDLVKAFGTIFKYPYSKTTNEVQNNLRKKIVNEIYDTEKSYIKALETVHKDFQLPLLTAPKPIVPREDVVSIFSNIDQLTGVHHLVLGDLEEIVPNFSEETRIGAIFSKMNKNLRVYENYINNYVNAMNTLQKCMKLAPFKKFIDTALASTEHKDVTSLLIQPIQRIPRYILLISDLAKHTPSDHIDHDDIHVALQDIKDTAESINESKRTLENQAKIQSIETMLGGNFEKLAITGRGYVKEGTVLVKDPKKKVFKEHCLYLFTDSLLDTKKKPKEKVVAKKLIILKNVQVIALPDTKDQKNLFQIVKNSENYELLVSASTPADKSNWIKDIQNVIDKQSGKPSLKRIPTMTLVTKLEPSNQPTVTRQPSNPQLVSSPEMNRRSVNADLNIGASNLRQTPPDQNPLPEEWKEVETPDGKRYYYNKITKQTSWTRPDSSPVLQTFSQPSPQPAQIGEWRETTAPDGRIYYYNTVTKQTSWTKPV